MALDSLPRPEETRLVVRGVRRLLASLGHAALDEVPLASGRRADVVAIRPDGSIAIVEVKSSLEDFRADRKWPDYRLHCDFLYFAASPRVDPAIFPVEAGLIVADGHGGEVIREAPEHRLAAATRKALTLRLARLGAGRLMGVLDPNLGNAEW